jgi:hypothetical protein
MAKQQYHGKHDSKKADNPALDNSDLTALDTEKQAIPGEENRVPDNPAMDNSDLTTLDREKFPAPGDKKKAPANEPWNAENDPNHPSRRGILGVHKKRKGFEQRWVRHDSIDRRKMEGYVLAKPEHYDGLMTGDEKGMIRRNELVLMEAPTELVQARRDQAQLQADQQQRSAKQSFKDERERLSRQSGHDLSDEEEE